MSEKQPNAVDYTKLMGQLEKNRRLSNCRVCRDFTPETREFITAALKRGYTYAELATVLRPLYGDVVHDIRRHKKNGHEG